MSNPQSKSGIYIPSGEYLIGENAIFFDDDNPVFNFRLAGVNYYSDGNTILTLTNSGNTFAFKILDRALFVSFTNITFIGKYATTNAFLSRSDGGAQDYYFERCNFYGKFDTVFTIREDDIDNGNTNSEWSFNKCTFNGDINVIMDVRDSDQFLNYLVQ